MNHLAHCFLSFGDEDLLLGNFIGDFVKGNDWKEYPDQVQKGILLHRAIDSFTDFHPVTDQSVKRLRQFAGRFTPPIVDILYDYLLSTNWNKYTEEKFEDFALRTYTQLETRSGEMPVSLQERLPKMVAGKFLQGYSTLDGMTWVLSKFKLRLPIVFDHDATISFFKENLDDFNADFNAFFPELLAHAREKAGI